MTRILNQLPIHDRRTEARFGDRQVRIKPNQILVWVSIHLAGSLQPEKEVPRIPALLDTGNNIDSSIQHRHLREWAGTNPDSLPLLGSAEINEQRVHLHEAAIWLYPNVPGRTEVAADKPPFLLEMTEAIAVYPRDSVPPGPRLPLLGLPALLHNDLDFWLDPELRQVFVETRSWRRQFTRLLRRI